MAMAREAEPDGANPAENAPVPELGTILVIEDDPRMQKCCDGCLPKRITPFSSQETVRRGWIRFGLTPMAGALDLNPAAISGRELCQSIKAIRVRRRSLFSARLPRLWIKFCCWSWERTIM